MGAAAAARQAPSSRSRYDDVELLGRFVTGEGDGWRAPGTAMHVANGALFGATYAQVAPLLPGPPAAQGGAQMALFEHLALWPAGRLSDRYHPRPRRAVCA